MTKPRYWIAGCALVVALAVNPIMTWAEGAASVRIAGNQPDAESLAELGATAGITPAKNLAMRVVLAPRNQSGLNQLISDLQNPSSPEYHHWLAPGEFTARFGPTADQLAQVSAWLSGQGFAVTSASAEDRTVRFTGSAAQAAAAFQVEFAATTDGKHYANLNGPAVPADLANMIQSIQGLDNLHGLAIRPQPEVQIGPKKYAFGPPDLYALYDENSLLNDNINGTGADCIALIEFAEFDPGSIDAFDSFFGLLSPNLTEISVDGSGSYDPAAESETLADIEYSHTAAPEAPIIVYAEGTSPPGGSVTSAFLDPLQQSVNDDTCGSISLSIFVCPGEDSSLAASADTIYQEAAMQGQTVFAAAGDDGSAAVIFNAKKGCVAGKKRGLIETDASPNVTSVGGTEVKPKYDKSTGIVIPDSAAQTVWNESIGAGGGGASQVFSKPTYQNSVTPNDSARDIPDISLLAAVKTPGYIYAEDGELFCCGGGTSFGSPYWAGIAALMEQLNGGGIGGRLGPINTRLYSLASADASDHGIRDVTKGNNGFNGVKGYKAVPGYDQASGWGTPDIATFVHAYTGN